MGFDEELFSEDEEESIEECGIYSDGIMKKVKKIIITFKYSPKNDGFLQSSFLFKNAQPLKLILDRKTRWNSAVKMLVKFMINTKYIIKVYIDLNIYFDLSDFEICVLQKFVNVLNLKGNC